MDKKKDYIYMGMMPNICGYGIAVIGKSESEVRKSLEKSYNRWKKSCGDDFIYEARTFDKAMDYFGGWIEKKYFGFDYFDDFAK